MTNYLYKNHVAKILYRISNIFNDLRFDEMSAQKYQAGLSVLAGYYAELATIIFKTFAGRIIFFAPRKVRRKKFVVLQGKIYFGER